MLYLKRIYDQPAATDGYRILIDRLWPRGVSKDQAKLDLWLKDIAPSPELRRWFGHKPDRFAEFSTKYTAELAHNPAVATIQQIIDQQVTVTLLYAAKDPAINQAVVLRQFLEGDRGSR